MGSMAERLPVFHLVGMPSMRILKQGLICDHSLGDQVYDRFEVISAAACCVSARLTPENAVIELERVIDKALEESRPAYLSFPMDLALMPITNTLIKGSPLGAIKQRTSVSQELGAVIDLVWQRIHSAKSPVVLPTSTLSRYGLVDVFEDFLEATGLPYATTPMDKGLFSEAHPTYLGMYNGIRSSPSLLQSVVEDADILLDFGGVVMPDINTGLWSVRLDLQHIVSLNADWDRAGAKVFTSVSLNAILAGLTSRFQHESVASRWSENRPIQPQPFLPLHAEPEQPTNTSTFYARLQRFLNPSDLLVVDAGTCQLQIKALRLPADVAFESQTLWGSIGWATLAALGCDLGDPNRRVVMVTGDGGHQLTAQDIGVMGFVGSNPVVIVLNNGIYGIEVLISKTGHAYNDLPKCRYCNLPHVMGCEGWWTGRVSTISELEKAFEEINRHSCGAYLEVMIPQEENKPLAHDLIETFHKTTTPEIDKN